MCFSVFAAFSALLHWFVCVFMCLCIFDNHKKTKVLICCFKLLILFHETFSLTLVYFLREIHAKETCVSVGAIEKETK